MLELIQPILIIGLSAIAIKLYFHNRKYKRCEIEYAEYPEITTWDQDLSDQIEYAYNVKVYGKDTWDEVCLLRKNIEDLVKNKHVYTNLGNKKFCKAISSNFPTVVGSYYWSTSFEDRRAEAVRIIREHTTGKRYYVENDNDFKNVIMHAENYINNVLLNKTLSVYR